jgi:hypothetical protein
VPEKSERASSAESYGISISRQAEFATTGFDPPLRTGVDIALVLQPAVKDEEVDARKGGRVLTYNLSA